MEILNDIIAKVLSEFTPKIQAFGKVHIRFDHYVYWLECRLLSVSQAELSNLSSTIDRFCESINDIKVFVHKQRSTNASLSNTQAAHVQKLYDAVMCLIEPYNSEKLYQSSGKRSVLSLLPDLDGMVEYIEQTRDVLTQIDELVVSGSSKKSDTSKVKGSKMSSSNRSELKKSNEMVLLKSEVKVAIGLLEDMHNEVLFKTTLLSYFTDIKKKVHIPLQALAFRVRTLPSMSDSSSYRDRELENWKRLDEIYLKCRTNELLGDATSVEREMRWIENNIKGKLNYLLVLYRPDIGEVLRSIYLQSQQQQVAEQGSDFGKADNDVRWYIDLERILRYPTHEMLRVLTKEKTKMLLHNAVVSARHYLNGEPWQLQFSDKISDEEHDSILAIDIELVYALMEDWAPRKQRYDALVQRSEFLEAYEALTIARSNAEKARSKCEQIEYTFGDIVSQHRDANANLVQLKERFVEIALSEVSEEIEFVS